LPLAKLAFPFPVIKLHWVIKKRKEGQGGWLIYALAITQTAAHDLPTEIQAADTRYKIQVQRNSASRRCQTIYSALMSKLAQKYSFIFVGKQSETAAINKDKGKVGGLGSGK